MWKGKRPSLGHIKIWGCEVFVRREAQDKLEARSEKCLFVGYPEESFGYLFYRPKDNVVFVARRGTFLEREMISKEDSGSKIDLEEIQESADEEPIVNTDTQQEVVTPVEPDDISLPIRRTSSRVSKPSQDPQFYYGFHIEEDKISDSTLIDLNEPVNYKKEVDMAVPEALSGRKAMEKRDPVYVIEQVAVRSGMDSKMAELSDVSYALSMSSNMESLKQDTVADSTCKSEYIAACEASKEAIWMKIFIGDLGVVSTVQDPIEIFCDNESEVA
ncbi:retrotransposon protein, putative, ty1-copia subclass [Tanacetum coccineum]